MRLKLWSALMRYRDDGRVEIDNNAAERALRAVALGRKNYLFAGSDAGGERAASIYSLIGTAKLNGLDPEAYLREVLERIAEHPSTALMSCCPGTSNSQANSTRTMMSLTSNSESRRPSPDAYSNQRRPQVHCTDDRGTMPPPMR